MLYTLLVCTLIIFVYMSFLFLLALHKKDNGIADVGWGIGFMLIALYTLTQAKNITSRALLVTLMTFVWASRLSIHIYQRNKGKGEDPRYSRWRNMWGKAFIMRSFFQVFMLQGLIMLMIAIPIIMVNSSTADHLGFLDLLGFSVWLIGLFFESIADYQLYVFLQDPAHREKIMMKGLWRYSRHPNYFGETLIWWGMFIIALNIPWGFISIISPITISYILLFVSGIPMVEQRLRGLTQFAEYKRKTSIFIPWFTKKEPRP